ncbi:MAG: TraB/GumN family protein [Bacteroidales bacterium]|nr:TraB/GumN family protein [Bacteroidales bacterium]
MAYRLTAFQRNRSAFYTIGIGHLPGKEGLIEILRGKEGFTVTNPR